MCFIHVGTQKILMGKLLHTQHQIYFEYTPDFIERHKLVPSFF